MHSTYFIMLFLLFNFKYSNMLFSMFILCIYIDYIGNVFEYMNPCPYVRGFYNESLEVKLLGEMLVYIYV